MSGHGFATNLYIDSSFFIWNITKLNKTILRESESYNKTHNHTPSLQLNFLIDDTLFKQLNHCY